MGQVLRRKSGTPPILEQVESSPPDPQPAQSTLVVDPPPIPEEIPLDMGNGISRNELKLPPVPGTYLNWDQWEAYATTLTVNHWSHIDCYLYRYFPIIDQEPKYIDMVGVWQDLNYYTERHGGGKYGLSVCDRSLSKRQQEICTVRFEIDWHKFDPKLTYSTLELGDKRNRAYISKLINKGILSPDLEVIPMQPRSTDQSELVNKLVDKVTDLATDRNNKNNQPRDSGIENQAASAAIKMVSDVSQKLMEQQITSNDPLKQIEAMAKLVGLGQGGNNGSDKTFELMKFMMESQAKMTQIMLDMNKAANDRMEKLIEKMDSRSTQGNGGSDMDKLDTFLTIAERLGGGGTQSTLQTIVGAAKEILPAFVGPLVNILMAKQTPYPISQQPQPTQVLVPSNQVPPGFDPNAGVPPIMPNPNDQSQPVQASIVTGGVTKEQVAGFISQFGSNITQAMERGDTGADLAQSLETLAGYEKYLQIRAIVEDREIVMEGAALVPQFYMVIKGHGLDKFSAFIDSFCEWATLRESNEEDGGLS